MQSKTTSSSDPAKSPNSIRRDAARPWLLGAIFVWTLTGAVAWAAYSSRAVPTSPVVLVPDLSAVKAPAEISGTAQMNAQNSREKPSSAKGIAWEETFEGAMQRARKENKPLMINFYTDWCTWCKELDRTVFPDKKVVEEAKNWVSIRLNAEKRPDVAGAYGVTGYPTIVFAEKSGKTLSILPGFAPAPDFVIAMKEAHAKLK